jgi:hypothetical protein
VSTLPSASTLPGFVVKPMCVSAISTSSLRARTASAWGWAAAMGSEKVSPTTFPGGS